MEGASLNESEYFAMRNVRLHFLLHIYWSAAIGLYSNEIGVKSRLNLAKRAGRMYGSVKSSIVLCIILHLASSFIVQCFL